MVLKINLKKLLICILIPLIAGGLSTLTVGSDIKIYGTVIQPPLAPPSWLFPLVWTLLYILMGISLYLVRSSNADDYSVKSATAVFAVQLFLNFIWSPVFFKMRLFLAAFFILTALLVAVIVMTVRFYKISKPAGLLQIPYIIWLAFAGYLNIGIYILN